MTKLFLYNTKTLFDVVEISFKIYCYDNTQYSESLNYNETNFNVSNRIWRRAQNSKRKKIIMQWWLEEKFAENGHFFLLLLKIAFYHLLSQLPYRIHSYRNTGVHFFFCNLLSCFDHYEINLV